MEQLFYPAIFQTEEGGGFSIFFPDIEGCITQGEDLSDGYKMAFDALGITLSYLSDEKKPIPSPSIPQNIKLLPNQFIVVIEFNMLTYLKKHNSTSVKKTLTIPSWLNELALEQDINFSQALQEALMEKLQVRS